MEDISIEYSARLKDYMKHKGYSYIALESVSPKGCCVDLTELATKFVSDNHAQELKENGCGVMAAPVGEILILSKGLEYDKKLYFGLRSFFGVKDITVKGVYPWRL